MEKQHEYEEKIMFQTMNQVYEVYKERSFSKAAANLYISQPALSAAVKRVEEKIGVPIFDRSVNPIQLTECGKKYIKSIEEIMDIESQFENYINNINDLKTGQIAIGGSNLFASYILPPIIAKFAKLYPQIKIHLKEDSSPKLMKQLFQNELDLIIDNTRFSEDIYKANYLTEETLLLAVPKTFNSNETAKEYQLSAADILNNRHKLADIKSVPLEFFANEPFIFLRSGNDTRSRAEQLCNAQGFVPNIILKLDQQATAFHVCSYGIGISFISDNVVKNVRYTSECIFYKLDEQLARRDISIYHKQTKYVTRAMDAFIRVAKEEMEEDVHASILHT